MRRGCVSSPALKSQDYLVMLFATRKATQVLRGRLTVSDMTVNKGFKLRLGHGADFGGF